jgi:fumarate hydratase subunit beta
MKNLTLPMTKEQLSGLHAGDAVRLSGVLYTARDAAHKRISDLLDAGDPLPFELSGAAIYYAGPCPTKPGHIFGSCGPTTSGRMNAYAPRLFDLGVQCTIGKGPLSRDVISAIRKNGAVYFCATGGAGALISACVKSAKTVAFEDLGAEAVTRLVVEDFPAIVGVDAGGNNIVR